MSKIYILIIIAFCSVACTSSKTSDNIELDISSAKAMITKDKNVIVLDVRTAEEVEDGKIENSENMDFFGDDFENELKNLDLEKKYIVYCRSGNRSGKTVTKLREMGFKEAYNLTGGYEAWKKGDK